jgi:CheY-like chemotaxis protein
MSRILLVDDDVDLAGLVKTKLEVEGHEVAVTHSGEGAFELAKEFTPDIAILDIMLPGVTGYQICRRLRKDPELYKIGILILTALGEEPEILHGLEQGADLYLAKPFRLEDLIDKLSNLDQLLAAIERRDPVTQLPGTDLVKREINHRLARGAALAACYIDMVGYKQYCRIYESQDGKTKALQFMSRHLTQLTRQLGIYEGFIAHLGGEHFVVLVNLEDYERLCSNLIKSFDETVAQLYRPEDMQKGFVIGSDKSGRKVRYPLMALSVGVAHTQFRHYKNAKKMFEVLAQARQMAQPDGSSAIFVDRRKADR